MSRPNPHRVAVVSVLLAGCFLVAALGSTCPLANDGTAPFNPPVPTGNRPPRIMITGITTPTGGNFAQQGDQVVINFAGEDGEDAAVARVFASTSQIPTPAQEIPILAGYNVGPGAATGSAPWNTGPVSVGSYFIFAEINDLTFDPLTNTGNPAVRVQAADPIVIAPIGTAPENGPPTVTIQLPAVDAGLSNDETLSLRFRLNDPNSDEDTIHLTYYFDKDRNAANDDVDPPLMVGEEDIAAGTIPVGAQLEVTFPILIDLDTLPIRRELDEGGRPLPYFVRVRADDGEGAVVDQYAAGAVRLLRAASQVVDLLSIGGATAGATFQGPDGFPDDPTRGGRAGSGFSNIGDFDADGLDDFVILAETNSPFIVGGKQGEAFLIMGRAREVNPDQPNAFIAQGRISGAMSLNTVGTFVPFPPQDPRYEQIFNIRGSIIPMTDAGNNLGLTGVSGLPDCTGDGLPEILFGMPRAIALEDREDLDPCDICAFDEDQRAPFTCFQRGIFRLIGSNPLVGTLDNPGVLIANQWFPFDPANPPFPPGVTFPPNINLELDENRPLRFFQFQIRISGTREDDVAQNFSIMMQLEDPQGPMVTQTVQVVPNGDGQFNNVIIPFPVPIPNFPTGVQDPSGAPVAGLPGSVYDGLFSLFIKPSTQITLDEVEIQISAELTVPEDHPIRHNYEDGFPQDYSDTMACDAITPSPVDPLALIDLHPVCPPMNRSSNPLVDFPGLGNRDGQLCEDVPMGSANGFTNDDLVGPTGFHFYESGLVFMSGSDDLVLPVDPLTNELIDDENPHFPVAPIDFFGQPPYLIEGGLGMEGGRFRGAWYNPALIYEPDNFFGYTIDVQPTTDGFGFASHEVIISSPRGGVLTTTPPIDLALGLVGSYSTETGMTTGTAPFDAGFGFTVVTSAFVLVTGSATDVARIRIGIDDGTGHPSFFESRDILAWDGAGPQGADEAPAPIDYDELFGDAADIPPFGFFPLVVQMPQAALVALRAGNGSIALELLPDCVVENTTAEIFSAELIITGLRENSGFITVVDDVNYGSSFIDDLCALENEGDQEGGELRPMSWPSTGCVDDIGRVYCFPFHNNEILGEQADDGLGFARNAGDLGGPVGLDGVSDIACGSPGSDSDPFAPDINCFPDNEPNKLMNNGKTFLIYGDPTIAVIARPCDLNRFEIRGSHHDDQFGRVQGTAGDINGDGIPDMYVAAEGYDATSSPVGTGPNAVAMPITGVDAGFVGVLFGSPSLTGEIAINAERVGTGNFKGVKFIGASRVNPNVPVRLGGGTPAFTGEFPVERGQYGVSSAGDYNRDGFDDLLITAPGQIWPAARLRFTGSVADGQTVTINGTVFEFDTNSSSNPANQRVALGSTSALAAQTALMTAMDQVESETLRIASLSSQSQFPDPLPDIPTITFLGTKAVGFSVVGSGATVQVELTNRLGVAYLVFGSDTLLSNKTFVLPDDLNRRNSQGFRVLKGITFVSAYEQDTDVNDATPDQAPVEVVARAGDVDGDGFVDILLGAPTADFINILSPNQRRQSSGDAYLIYGNEFGLNKTNTP